MLNNSAGRYRAKITVGYDAAGRPVYKYVSGRTKRELEAKRAALVQERVAGASNA